MRGAMKISDFVKIVKPSYKYYKITPNNSIKNNETYKIVRSINSLYKNIFQMIKKEDEKLIRKFGKEFLIGTKYRINTREKVGYFIYIEKKKVNFYLIVPEQYSSIIIDKVNDVWNNITLNEVDELPNFSNRNTKYNLIYDKEDAMSLKTDRRSNDLLNSNLNIINILEGDDKVGIFYNFMPTSQFTWKNEYKNTIAKYNDNKPVDRDKGSTSYLLKYALKFITNIVDNIFTSLSSGDKMRGNENALDVIANKITGDNELSHETHNKINNDVIETQIVLFSESDENGRQRNNAKSLSQSYETIANDNRLVAKRNNRRVNFNDFKLKAPTNKMSDVECQNFLSIPGRDILEEYSFIDKVETNETQVPEELQNGIINIGDNIYKGYEQKAYLSDDKEYKNLTQMLIGPTRAGKSTLIGNMSRDAINNGECVIMFDFIKNTELSNEVAELFSEDKVLNIECNDFEKLQGLGYNEVGYENDIFKQYDNAKKQTTQLMTLINSVNSDDVSLTAKMERYLTSAALVVFIDSGSIKDVFNVLQNYKERHKFINKIPDKQLDNLKEYIDNLYTLDDKDKNDEVVGTKLNLVVGIIDRLNKLKANTYMELMLKKGVEDNVDLSEEIQKNQLICIKMPEDMFSTDDERDVYTTYWMTKLWLALQMRARNVGDRDNHTKVNLVIDEIYQVENTEKFITEKLSRFAKFSLKPIISCHYINQLKHMRSELRSANASYMLISGCDKNNYNEFKEELYPFQLEDLLNLPRFNSMNLIKHKNGYGKFITKLPKPIGI